MYCSALDLMLNLYLKDQNDKRSSQLYAVAIVKVFEMIRRSCEDYFSIVDEV
jgi:hypothetical protein